MIHREKIFSVPFIIDGVSVVDGVFLVDDRYYFSLAIIFGIEFRFTLFYVPMFISCEKYHNKHIRTITLCRKIFPARQGMAKL